MSKSAKIWIAAAVAVVLVVLAATGVVLTHHRTEKAKDDAVAVTVPLALKAEDAPRAAKIGVVLTLGNSSAEGAEWNQSAQGVRVAQHRYELGGASVDVVVANDNGTTDGARRAVKKLVGQNVSGIIMATSGPHMDAGLDAAAQSSVPVIAPYAPVTGHAGQWSLAPADDEVSQGFTQAFGAGKKTEAIDADGASVPQGLLISETVKFSGNDDPNKLARKIAQTTKASAKNTAPVTSLVISGEASTQATLVKALQAADVTVPIGLTGDATSPVFAQTLDKLDGSVSSNLITVGTDADDAAALHPDGHGRAMSAFLNGVRVLSENEHAKNLTEDQPFSKVADNADSRSHDAMTAFVQALDKAGSADPKKVGKALGQLSTRSSDGIAGAELDFTRGHNASADAIGPLHASSQQLALRPHQDSQRLVWFAADAS